jgi:CRISPR-associated protein Csm2
VILQRTAKPIASRCFCIFIKTGPEKIFEHSLTRNHRKENCTVADYHPKNSNAGRPGQGYKNNGAEKLTLPAFSLAEVSVDLFSDKADQCAKVIAANGGTRSNKPTQIRRFYDEVCMWHEKVGQDQARFTECLPFIKMIGAKVAYARGRDLVDESFMQYMENALKQVNDLKTFHTFKTFMEAFVGYYKMHKPK